MHNWQCVCCAGLFSKPSWQSPFRHTYKSILRCISNTIFIGQFLLIHKCQPIWISFFVILRVRFRFFQFSSVWIAEKERIIYGKLVCFMSLFSFFLLSYLCHVPNLLNYQEWSDWKRLKESHLMQNRTIQLRPRTARRLVSSTSICSMFRVNDFEGVMAGTPVTTP